MKLGNNKECPSPHPSKRHLTQQTEVSTPYEVSPDHASLDSVYTHLYLLSIIKHPYENSFKTLQLRESGVSVKETEEKYSDPMKIHGITGIRKFKAIPMASNRIILAYDAFLVIKRSYT